MVMKKILGRKDEEILADMKLRRNMLERRISEEKSRLTEIENEMLEHLEEEDVFDDLYDDYEMIQASIDRKKKMRKALNKIIGIFDSKADLTDDMGTVQLLKEALESKGLNTKSLDEALRSFQMMITKMDSVGEKLSAAAESVRSVQSETHQAEKEKLRERLRQKKMQLKAEIEAEKEKLKSDQ
jgi:hypothetical protein